MCLAIASAAATVSRIASGPVAEVLAEPGDTVTAGHGAGDPEADAAADAALAPLPGDEFDRAASRELRENQRATLRALQRWPGIETRYRRLVDAAIAQRPKLEKLPPAEAARERLLRQALHAPGSVAALPPLPPKAKATQPVLLWLSNFRGAQQGGLTGMGSGGEAGEAGVRAPAPPVPGGPGRRQQGRAPLRSAQ